MTDNFTEWDGVLACQEVDYGLRLDTTQISTSTNCFIYILVYAGGCEFTFNHERMSLRTGDIMIFPPASPPIGTVAEKGYHALGLIVQQDYAYRHLPANSSHHVFLNSIAIQKAPKVAPSAVDFALMIDVLHMMKHRMLMPRPNTNECMSSLYNIFMSDLATCMQSAIPQQVSSKSTKIFLSFLDLLNENYKVHHDIPFYASRLDISPRYLSMISKEVTGQTVLHFIKERITLEACWLLKTTDMSVSQISQELSFADQASFCKFFKRVKGKKPLQYRHELET